MQPTIYGKPVSAADDATLGKVHALLREQISTPYLGQNRYLQEAMHRQLDGIFAIEDEMKRRGITPPMMMAVHPFPGAKRAAKDPVRPPSGYKLVAKGNDAAELYIYGAIGGDWFGEGITAKQVADDLKALGKVSSIDVRINSEGGNVFDGKAIYSLLNEHKATINVKIDGLAASAASFIAMAGNTIEIAEGAFVMVHDAYGVAVGRAEDMRAYASLLDQVNGTIRDVYRSRTKQTDAKIKKWMSDETWFTAAEAVANGFADKMTENLKVAASVSHPEMFKKLPASLKPNHVRATAAFARIAAAKA